MHSVERRSLGVADPREERMRNERFICDVETPFFGVPPVRGWSASLLWRKLHAMRSLRRTLERGTAGNPPADNRPARHSREPRLRGVWPSGDAAPPRWGVPLLGVRLGGTSARFLGNVEMQVDSSKAQVFQGRALRRRAKEGRDQRVRNPALGPKSAPSRECRTYRATQERHSSLLPKGRYKISSS
jgi:hypothetical protein